MASRNTEYLARIMRVDEKAFDNRTILRPAKGSAPIDIFDSPSALNDNSSTPAEALAGEILLGRFRLQEIIGRGGMGVVFRASDLHMQGEPAIAIKLLNDALRTNPDADAALQRECRKVRMLAHDAIVRVFEFYRADAQAFITMELLEGDSLDRVLKKFPDGVLFADAWPILSAAGSALAYAHRQNPPFVHSDFKPSNVFLTQHNQVKVLDFGVARAAKSSVDGATVMTLFDPGKLGALTPAYASCEMLAEMDPDPRDDVYAFACVAYELLSGQHPFGRRPADKARGMQLKPEAITGLTKRQNQGLFAGLAFERDARTPSVERLMSDLADRGERRDEHRFRKMIWTIGFCALALVLVVGYGIWRTAAPVMDSSPGNTTVSSNGRIEPMPQPAPDASSRDDEVSVIAAASLSGVSVEQQRQLCDRLEKEWNAFSCDARKACYRLRAGWNGELSRSLEAVDPDNSKMFAFASNLYTRVAGAACENMAAVRDRSLAEFKARYPQSDPS